MKDAPLVTLGLTSYQDVDYLPQAIASLLAQDYRPLQIIISDDCSTDGSWDLIQKLTQAYDGPHQLLLQRNQEQRRVENYNAILEKAEGEYFVIAHSDDIALPHRVSQLVAALREHDVTLVSSNAECIDHNGRPLGLLCPVDSNPEPGIDNLIKYGWRVTHHGATLAWNMALYREFGGLENRYSAFQTDWILPFQAALLKGVHFIGEPLLKLRKHNASRSNQHLHAQRDHLHMYREGMMASAITQTVYRFRTLEDFIRRHPEQKDKLHPLLALLRKKLLIYSADLAEARNQLALEGLRPRWEKTEDAAD